MTRYSQLRRLMVLGGLVAAGVLAVAAVPSGATIICPPGAPSTSPYCTNVPPIAITLRATDVRRHSAQLNGLAGPDVRGGDLTQYYFEYGTTRFYGSQTPTGTIGKCPPGDTASSSYCIVPKIRFVWAPISGLYPCTRYHFIIVASNSDGTSWGQDRVFRTRCRGRYY
jgi:hypothetical protein